MREGDSPREDITRLGGDVAENTRDKKAVEGDSALVPNEGSGGALGFPLGGGGEGMRLASRGSIGRACRLDLPGLIPLRPRLLQARGGIPVTIPAVLLALGLLRHKIPLSRE